MKARLLFLTILLPSTFAFADTPSNPIPNPHKYEVFPEFVEKCRKTAIRKLRLQAKYKNAILDPSTVIVTQLDERFLSATKYAWFTGVAVQADGTLIQLDEVLTQKPAFFPCR